MMMGMLGGISESSAPEAVMHPMERLLSYPCLTSSGMAILQKTMLAATDMPLTAPNRALPATVAIMRPPGIFAVHFSMAL